jgi:RNA 2',3'-cyclic 3'-phosphodiesterase
MSALSQTHPWTNKLLFLAQMDVQTASPVDALVESVRKDGGLTSPSIPIERRHVTLHHIGNFPEVWDEVVGPCRAAGDRVAMPQFLAVFDRITSFRGAHGNSPLVLLGDDGVIGLRILHRLLGEALGRSFAGRWQPRRFFTPHVTLLYDRQRIAERPIVPVSWTVREFVLVNSLVGLGRHDVLARWPLRSVDGVGQSS